MNWFKKIQNQKELLSLAERKYLTFSPNCKKIVNGLFLRHHILKIIHYIYIIQYCNINSQPLSRNVHDLFHSNVQYLYYSCCSEIYFLNDHYLHKFLLFGRCQNRNTIISTNLNHSIHHFLSITSCKIFTVPSGKEKILAVGYFSISPSHSIASLSLNTSIPPIESNLKPSLCPPTTIT